MAILDTLIFPNDHSYQIQIVKYILPDDANQQIRTHHADGSVSVGTYKEMLKQYDGHIIVRLIDCKENAI